VAVVSLLVVRTLALEALVGVEQVVRERMAQMLLVQIEAAVGVEQAMLVVRVEMVVTAW
jgi:hypothetical protein